MSRLIYQFCQGYKGSRRRILLLYPKGAGGRGAWGLGGLGAWGPLGVP